MKNFAVGKPRRIRPGVLTSGAPGALGQGPDSAEKHFIFFRLVFVLKICYNL